uniref:Uncharacterized protein n=1 Tax=Onchocerca volvulus TaxID=6282 RepID=A0A8R1TKL9_ONCVO
MRELEQGRGRRRGQGREGGRVCLLALIQGRLGRPRPAVIDILPPPTAATASFAAPICFHSVRSYCQKCEFFSFSRFAVRFSQLLHSFILSFISVLCWWLLLLLRCCGDGWMCACLPLHRFSSITPMSMSTVMELTRYKLRSGKINSEVELA